MHTCYRTIDKPQTFFGLEQEDLAAVVLVIGIGGLLFEPYVPGAIGIICWILISRLKSGKPPGYLMHWLYSQGLGLPGLPPSPRGVSHYGSYASTTF